MQGLADALELGSRSGALKRSVKELRERCKAAGVKVSGRKDELVTRLRERKGRKPKAPPKKAATTHATAAPPSVKRKWVSGYSNFRLLQISFQASIVQGS